LAQLAELFPDGVCDIQQKPAIDFQSTIPWLSIRT